MNNWKRYTIFLALLVLLVTGVGVLLAQTGGGFTLTWGTVDGGGGSAAGGGYAMSGTAGQPDVSSSLSGGRYTLAGGFWHGGGIVAPTGYQVFLPLVLR